MTHTQGKKLWRVFSRTPRTTWVELNAFDNEKDARDLVREILNSGGHEAMIETDEGQS